MSNFSKNNALLTNTSKTPFNVIGSPGDSKVYLAWNPPNNMMESITDYSIQYSQNSGATWTTVNKPSSTATSYVISGLENSISYLFRVAFINNSGIGRYSAPSLSITPSDSGYKAYVSLANDTIGYITDTKNPIIDSIGVDEAPSGVAINKNTNKIYVSNGQRITVIDMNSKTIIKNIEWTARIGALAINYSTNQIYGIDGFGTNRIIVINGDTDTITGTIMTGSNPFNMAINNITNRLYVVNASNTSPSISVVNCNTNTVIQTLSVVAIPISIAVNPVTNKIYVGHEANSSPRQMSLSVIDGNTNTIIKNFTISSYNGRSAIGINTSTNKIYIMGTVEVLVVDGITDSILHQIDIPSIFISANPVYASVNEALNRIYFTSSKHLIVFDGGSNMFVSGLMHSSSLINSTVPQFNQILSESSSNIIYAACSVGFTITPNNSLAIIDENNISNFITTNSVGSNPGTLATNSISNKIYITNTNSNTVSVVDSNTETITKTIAVGIQPYSVVLNENTNTIYVLNNNTSGARECSLTIIDGVSDTIVATLALKSNITTTYMAINPMTNKLYIPYNDGSSRIIYVIDINTNSIVKNIILPTTVGSIGYIGINIVSNEIYITGVLGSSVVVINGFNDTISTTINLTPSDSIRWLSTNSFTNKTYIIYNKDIDIIDGETKGVRRQNLSAVSSIFLRTSSVNSNTNRLYMGGQNNIVRILDTDKEIVTQDIMVPAQPRFIGR
jgi:YVTN family beta-propeller protein